MTRERNFKHVRRLYPQQEAILLYFTMKHDTEFHESSHKHTLINDVRQVVNS